MPVIVEDVSGIWFRRVGPIGETDADALAHKCEVEELEQVVGNVGEPSDRRGSVR